MAGVQVAENTDGAQAGKRYAVRQDLTTGGPRQLPQGAAVRFPPASSQTCACQDLIRRNAEPWDNGIAARFMPKRYTSRELVKLAEEFGWVLVGVRGDHHNFKHPASRFIVTIVHPPKRCTGGASGGCGEENQVRQKKSWVDSGSGNLPSE